MCSACREVENSGVQADSMEFAGLMFRGIVKGSPYFIGDDGRHWTLYNHPVSEDWWFVPVERG